MPMSILKYVDVARLVGAGLKCPVCNGTDCRHSRWLSKVEKLGSAGFRPYRCNDCAHRFLARNGASLERILINCTAAIMLCFGVWLGVDFWLESVDKPESALPSARAADPMTPAQKQQEAADSGDTAAMLQLGRDLATGNNRPRDVGQAAKWVQLAAATGNPEGMLELGRYYRDGVGLVQDHQRAYVWLSRAAAANHPDALLERDALVRTMSEEKLKAAQQLSLPTQPAVALVDPR